MYIKLRKSKKSFRSIILLDFFCPLRRDRDVVRVYTITFCYDKKTYIILCSTQSYITKGPVIFYSISYSELKEDKNLIYAPQVFSRFG